MDLNSAFLLLVVAGCGAGAAVVAWMLAKVVTAVVAKSKGTLDDLMAQALSGPLAAFAGLVTAGVGLVLLGPRMDADAVVHGRRILLVLFVVLAAWGLSRVLRGLLERAGAKRDRFQPAARVGSRLVAVVVYTVAFLMVMSVYGLSITPVLTGLGIAGLAVALALKDTGANFFAGIWIQTGKALQPGHYVRLEEEDLEGLVEEVGWRVTRIRTMAGNTVVVPNNKLAQSVTTDYNLPDKTMAIRMRFRAAFEAEPDLVLRVLVEEAKEAMKDHEGILEAEPFASLAEIADDANIYEVSFRVTEFVQQRRAQQIMRLRVLRRFQKEGIRIPYPTMHNFEEMVESRAAQRRPARVRTRERNRTQRPGARRRKPGADPFLQEAEKAQRDIAAQQREKGKSDADGGKGRAAAAGTDAGGSPGIEAPPRDA